jgi:hypothetical protein
VKRLERSVAVERLERLELTDPHDERSEANEQLERADPNEWSIAVERFERLEQAHPQCTASCPISSRVRELPSSGDPAFTREAPDSEAERRA